MNRQHGKLIPDCPIGFRVEDGRLVREDQVLPPPILHRVENPLRQEVKGKTYTLTDEEAHVRLWGMAAKKKERYSRAGKVNTEKLPLHLKEKVKEGVTVLSR